MAPSIRRCRNASRIVLPVIASAFDGDDHCPEAGGEHTKPPHFRLMMACAEICRDAAHFMLLGTPHHKHLCGECAEICAECADDCERIGDMGDCVDACRRCAESCRQMAA